MCSEYLIPAKVLFFFFPSINNNNCNPQMWSQDGYFSLPTNVSCFNHQKLNISYLCWWTYIVWSSIAIQKEQRYWSPSPALLMQAKLLTAKQAKNCSTERSRIWHPSKWEFCREHDLRVGIHRGPDWKSSASPRTYPGWERFSSRPWRMAFCWGSSDLATSSSSASTTGSGSRGLCCPLRGWMWTERVADRTGGWGEQRLGCRQHHKQQSVFPKLTTNPMTESPLSNKRGKG